MSATMSFGQKIASIMERPGEDPVSKDDVPWWMKYAGRGLGTGGSLFSIFLGAWNCLSIIFGDASCFLSGIIQMIVGFLVVTIEAPCCCLFIDFVQSWSDWVEKRPYWNRAVGYCLLSVVPIIFCRNFTSIFGNALVFGTGAIYGLMSIGKKASFDEMRTAAGVNQQQSAPTNMKMNLVESAQPIGLSTKPDSNV